MKQFQKTLFIFRRDLRLEDNTGLIFALKNSAQVIPAFILTPEQIDDNPYQSLHCLKFMVESLQDLEKQLKSKKGKLFLFKGDPQEIVERCIAELGIDAVVVNRDYTPYSIQRDAKIEKSCEKKKVAFISLDDALLHPPEMTVKKNGQPYLIFTPYYRNAARFDVPAPVSNRLANYFRGKISFAKGKLPDLKGVKTGLIGGRSAGLKLLKNIQEHTYLSPYLKFTVVSPREVYHALAHHPTLIRALYWRDFFTAIAFFFPHVFKGAFHPKYDKLKWSYDKKAFKRWCEGATGFPIVDAGMRELNQTGMIDNRTRMIVASFLVKDLHIDWRWGEKYFAQMLLDYDPAVNNGNWQWVASTGCDAQPYFRIFNPWGQQKKFDPQCAYIKKWIPEVKQFSPKEIHNWATGPIDCQYPPPMVDHSKEAAQALAEYRKRA